MREYVSNNQKHVARASPEVILAGGVINSPQLLLLSGVGSSEQRKKHGIETRVELREVGENLQDHVSPIIFFARKAPGPIHRGMRYDRLALAAAPAWDDRRY